MFKADGLHSTVQVVRRCPAPRMEACKVLKRTHSKSKWLKWGSLAHTIAMLSRQRMQTAPLMLCRRHAQPTCSISFLNFNEFLVGRTGGHKV